MVRKGTRSDFVFHRRHERPASNAERVALCVLRQSSLRLRVAISVGLQCDVAGLGKESQRRWRGLQELRKAYPHLTG